MFNYKTLKIWWPFRARPLWRPRGYIEGGGRIFGAPCQGLRESEREQALLQHLGGKILPGSVQVQQEWSLYMGEMTEEDVQVS